MVRDLGIDLLEYTNALGPLKDPIALAIFSSGLEKYFHEHRPPDFPRASTRGHFRVNRLNATPISPESRLGRALDVPKKYFLDGAYDETTYATVGEIPGMCDDDADPAEVTIFVHGWLSAEEAALGRMSLLRYSMERLGYEHPVIGFTYDTDQSIVEWRSAKVIGTWNGPKLAQFTLDYLADNPDTRIRYISNSGGAMPVLSAMEYMNDRGHEDVLESVTLLGGSVPSGSVAVDGRYGSAIQAVTGSFHNYYTSSDRTLRQYYRIAERTPSVGGSGSSGRTPDNYTDHRVDYVDDHFSFFIPDRGCMDEVLDDFAIEPDPSAATVSRDYDAFDEPE